MEGVVARKSAQGLHVGLTGLVAGEREVDQTALFRNKHVDNWKRYREPLTFQVSLRRLLLWTAILSALLGAFRSLGLASVGLTLIALWAVGLGVLRETLTRRMCLGFSAMTGMATTFWHAFLSPLLGLTQPFPAYAIAELSDGVALGCLVFVCAEIAYMAVQRIDALAHAKIDHRKR